MRTSLCSNFISVQTTNNCLIIIFLNKKYNFSVASIFVTTYQTLIVFKTYSHYLTYFLYYLCYNREPPDPEEAYYLFKKI
ncbi:hypothetical protein BpHYR1_037292 [Brachionus plicatilis]|uniref:Uncharacterized protein n=1 Tax=Brachionus plicatilis TaxID=10195 RepID=A0A3M7S539_BRAPC|nr:hypothetical protein BpHYR1_037292 [Brachionus plicatilis]